MSTPAMAAEVSVSDAVPTTVGNVPGYVANPNPLNTPPATGLITVPQSPSGAVNTNTGRTNIASETMAAAGLTGNPLVGWNGIRNPVNHV